MTESHLIMFFQFLIRGDFSVFGILLTFFIEPEYFPNQISFLKSVKRFENSIKNRNNICQFKKLEKIADKVSKSLVEGPIHKKFLSKI